MHVLCFQGEPVKTPQGKLVAHSNESLILHMIEEFDSWVSIRVRDGAIVEPKTRDSSLISTSVQIALSRQNAG